MFQALTEKASEEEKLQCVEKELQSKLEEFAIAEVRLYSKRKQLGKIKQTNKQNKINKHSDLDVCKMLFLKR